MHLDYEVGSMDSTIRSDVFMHTGQNVLSSVQISSGDALRTHYRIVLENQKEYIYKTVHVTNSVSTYKQIIDLRIKGFQHIDYLWQVNANTYEILARWHEGKCICDYQGMYKDEMIVKSARLLKKIHIDYQTTDKVFFSEETAIHFIQDNRQYFPYGSYEILADYILENLKYINGRVKTVVHGDMHFGNILICNDEVVFIDLDDICYGDCYMDLVYAANLVNNADDYHSYYVFLNTYFDYDIPIEFWKIVNIYSICKAINIMRCEERYTSQHSHQLVLDGFLKQHMTMQSDIPAWFEIEEKR